jgi:2-octaprenyl-6-methoxyphenol hydroxylase
MNATVLIAGGGPAGMALALALRRGGVAARIVEARARGAARDDKRILALAHSSRLILENILGANAWRAIPQTPIRKIHVSHQGGLGRTLIDAAEEGVPALGYVLAAGDLAAALDSAVAAAQIAYADNTPAPAPADAALTVHAEGRIEAAAEVHARDYGQHAVICTAQAATPHGGMAWERFTPQGPVALLPCGAAYAVVLSCAATDSARIGALDDDAFLALLQARFGSRVSLTAATARATFPLGLRVRRQPVGVREVWIGNAAQTLHPVAGQGFNLALRDIAVLADTLADAADPGAPALLARYAARRRPDRWATAGMTDGLVSLFSNDNPLLRHARGAGLLALDLLPMARGLLARQMMYGVRGLD